LIRKDADELKTVREPFAITDHGAQHERFRSSGQQELRGNDLTRLDLSFDDGAKTTFAQNATATAHANVSILTKDRYRQRQVRAVPDQAPVALSAF
jgi:hypothetical protein